MAVHTQLGRLEVILSVSLTRAAERCSAVADVLALLEERRSEPAATVSELSSHSAATLARRLTRAAAEWRSALP